MKPPISRRDALRTVATAGAGAFLEPVKALAQQKPLEIAGKPVELTLTAVTPQTVRITIQPIVSGQPAPVAAFPLTESIGPDTPTTSLGRMADIA